MKQRRNPYPGVSRVTDRHGGVRWRLRKTIKGRKIDAYLPGRYGSLEFRQSYEEEVNPSPAAPKTAGAYGTLNYVVSVYRGNRAFKELAPSTRYAKGKRLDWICSLIGKAGLADVKAHHIDNMMDRKGGPDAANRLLKEMSEIFEFARKRMGMTLPNPTGAIEKRKTRTGGYHTWTEAEVQLYRDAHPSGTPARLAMELMLATGAARQDACSMGRANIKGHYIYYRRGKTGQDTELPLKFMPALVDEIRQLPKGTAVFVTSKSGTAYTAESFGNWFADQCKAADLPDKCRAHGLRKRGATMLAEAGANEFQIMSFLAHKTTREALRYIKAAKRKTMAEAGMALIHSENMSNLSEWLDKDEA